MRLCVVSVLGCSCARTRLPCFLPFASLQDNGQYTSARINTKPTAGFYPSMQVGGLNG